MCDPQTANYDNVATKRREYDQDASQAQLETCNSQVVELQREVQHVNTPIGITMTRQDKTKVRCKANSVISAYFLLCNNHIPHVLVRSVR